MALLSDKQQRDLLIALGIIDFVTRGKVNAAAFDLSLATVKRVFPVAARAGLSVGGSAARAAIPLVTNPYLAGGALGYGALQTEQGQQLLEMAEDRGRMDRIRFEQGLADIEFGIKKKVKKTKSKFNSAVSKGMKAVKNSSSYGKKGIINAPKKAFKAVVATASKLSKAKKKKLKLPKPPKVGVSKVIYKSMIGLFK
jgi:hypothetical protein